MATCKKAAATKQRGREFPGGYGPRLRPRPPRRPAQREGKRPPSGQARSRAKLERGLRRPATGPLPAGSSSSVKRPSRSSTLRTLRWHRSCWSRSIRTALCTQLRSRLLVSRMRVCPGRQPASGQPRPPTWKAQPGRRGPSRRVRRRRVRRPPGPAPPSTGTIPLRATVCSGLRQGSRNRARLTRRQQEKPVRPCPGNRSTLPAWRGKVPG